MSKRLLKARAVAFALALVFAAQASAAAQADEITVEGRLARTVEAGGWLVVADAGKYLILNPRKFQAESWFREGALVEATGEARQGVVTAYQEGVPFQVRTMRGQARGGNTATNSTAVLGRGVTRVSVTGDASVQAQPDTAILTVAVVTQNASASEAQAENASRTDAVVRALKSAAGVGAEVRTSGYSLQPQYVYKEGAAPTITSYIARNAITVTMGDLNKVGAVIDAASRAGANNVEGLSFTLRRDEQARGQALTNATRDAVRKARVVADALGGRVVRVVEVQEASASRPPIIAYAGGGIERVAMTSQAPTPIESGSLEIRAQVQLVAEIETKE
jgi:uncharacterized protein YggE